MRLVARLLWVFALWVFPIGGCADIGQTPDSVPFTLTVFALDAPQGPRVPLEGAELCQADQLWVPTSTTENCALSDAEGRVSLEIPYSGTPIPYSPGNLFPLQTSVTLRKQGHASYLLPLRIMSFEDIFEDTFTMATDSYMIGQSSRVMSPYPPDAGAQPGGTLVECDLELPSGAKYAIMPVATPRTATVEYCMNEPPLPSIGVADNQQGLNELATCVSQRANRYDGTNLYVACAGWDSIRVYE